MAPCASLQVALLCQKAKVCHSLHYLNRKTTYWMKILYTDSGLAWSNLQQKILWIYNQDFLIQRQREETC